MSQFTDPPYPDHWCSRCEQGEKLREGKFQSFAGMVAIHKPSGNVCTKYMPPDVFRKVAEFERGQGETVSHDESLDRLSAAIEFANKVNPLPRCQHGKALKDGAGDLLEPLCGCRFAAPDALLELLKDLRKAMNKKHPCDPLVVRLDAEIQRIAERKKL